MADFDCFIFIRLFFSGIQGNFSKENPRVEFIGRKFKFGSVQLFFAVEPSGIQQFLFRKFFFGTIRVSVEDSGCFGRWGIQGGSKSFARLESG